MPRKRLRDLTPDEQLALVQREVMAKLDAERKELARVRRPWQVSPFDWGSLSGRQALANRAWVEAMRHRAFRLTSAQCWVIADILQPALVLEDA